MSTYSFVAQKQRGIYSEILNPDNSSLILDQTQLGPDKSFLLSERLKQNQPKANRLNKSSQQQFRGDQNQPQKVTQSRQQRRQRAISHNIGFMRTINEHDEQTIDPKVLEPYDPIPGRVPRKVAIDRKKKEYASYNLEELLQQEEIDFNNPNSMVEWLPLELFDDTTYDDYSNQEWIERKVDEDGKKRLITGKGLYKDPAGFYKFKNLIIEEYDKQTNVFVCKWKDTSSKTNLHRIFICLDCEDPRKYVKRIRNAFQERIYADSVIRYNNYIDNMPTQDLSELDTEQKKRLDQLAKTKQLDGMETTPLILEINADYARTMNKIIFDKYLEQQRDQEDDLYPRHLILPPRDTSKDIAPYFGMMPLERQRGAKLVWMHNYDKVYYEEPKDFTETFKDFCFSSLYIKEEVISALQEIRVECNKVLEMEVFNIDLSHAMVLEEFKHIQESAISQIMYHMKGAWINELTKIIKNNFTGVGKGWFNMKETSKITYDFGKLKRFLTVVRLMMQDTVLSLVLRCYKNLQKMILKFIPTIVQVKSASDIINQYEPWQLNRGPIKKEAPPGPLFSIELLKTSNDSDFIYSVKPENFVKMIQSTFEKGLEEVSKIPDLEPKILSDLYKSLKNETYIKTPMKPRDKPTEIDPNERPRKYPDENKWIWDLIEDVKAKLVTGLEPLQKYLQVFDKFKDVLKLDPDNYRNQIEANDSTMEVDQIQQEIIKVKKMEEDLQKNIPQAIQLGYFEISTKEISAYLCEKYYTMYKSLIDIIAKKARSSTGAIFNQFQMIQNKIKEIPTNIEKLVEIKEYMMSVPADLERIRLEMKQCFDIYAILDGFKYRFTKDDLDKKWIIFGSVKDTLELIDKRENELTKDQEKFQEQMKEEQKELKDRIDNLDMTINTFYNFQNLKDHADVAQTAIDVNKCLLQFQEDAKKYNSRESLFNQETTDYGKIYQMQKDFLPYSNLWINANKWFQYQEVWLKDPFNTLDAVTAERFVDESTRQLNGVIRFFNDKGITGVLNITKQVKGEIDQFKPKVPLMVALRKPGMMERHWQQITDKVGFKIPYQQEGFTFTTILNLDLMKSVDDCVEIGERAAKEYQIETMLEEMQKKWVDINFQIIPYKTSHIIRGYDEIQMDLDEHIVNTQAMQFSPFKKPFEDRILEWNNTLKTMSDVLEEWAKCQGQWMYLQPIFDSADIAKQLPAETKKFKTVDSTWKHTMNSALTLQNVLKVCTQEGLLERLQEANKNLEIIQKELNNYLEKKREKFARFYFLSNDDLLEILSQTKEPTAVQPHLKKVFENMQEIQFQPDKKITAMYSAEKEKVDFVTPVDPIKKNVEDWMGEVENMMCQSVRAALIKCVDDYSKSERTTWAISHPGQTILNGSQIVWTKEVEEAISTKGVAGVKQYWEKLGVQLNGLVFLVRQKLTKQQKTTINALIVIDVHAKDVVEKVYLENVKDMSAFEWVSQLRYYWENDEKNTLQCFVRCIQTRFPYGYEYLGNTLRLVITPLTDKCYMTLMGALKLNLGGAPAGPAGTGKTESTKDLAKALAKQCVVFNCSDSMDYIMVGKFFKGLASAGAWCCFDEFNRINIEVLSVIAQQLLILFGEKAKGTPMIEFEGSNIKILPAFCVFVTMNPGYAGRTELPDNLKALFRAVAMMVPDYAMIGEIMLYSFGFTKGRDLAKKMVATFKLSSEQLSSQDHYDYGMRAVRSVINAAGLLKAQDPDMDEEKLLLRALRDVNVPKFLKDDLPLFENIILDLFPGIDRPEINYGQLAHQIKQKAIDRNLQPTLPFTSKILQLYDTIQVRHGLMIVGPTGGGKTRNYQVLASAMTVLADQGEAKVNCHILNPKSITMGQLYGQFNEQTHEWTDGILAFRVRECCRDQSIDRHWVIFDGPVDSLWIESMNTVLDDNKKLCLNSGQMLTLTPYMTMVFEVEDLLVASPATVSRCGMIYMEPESLGYQVLIDSWLNTIPKNITSYKTLRKRIIDLWKLFLDDSLEFLRRHLKEPMPTVNNNLVQSLHRILDCYLVDFTETEIKKIQPEDLQNLFESIDYIFIFSLIWSVGCTTDFDGRILFSKWLKEQVANKQIAVIWPAEGDVYDYEFSIELKQFVHWNERNKNFAPDPKQGFHEVMVPTADSTRNIYLLKLLMQNNISVLNPGPTGTGKSQNIFQLLTRELGDNFQYISIAFSAQTSANQTQDTIDSKMDKRRKGVYGPPIGKKCIIFVDDLNMPKKETYGAQPPIEIIRQYFDHKGWYNRRDLLFMKMEDVIVLSAMGPPGGGRTFITNRIIRHFNVIGYAELSNDTINSIFTVLTSNFLKRYTEQVRNLTPIIVTSILNIYNTVKKDLLPTPSKSHYTFNLRDIWKVFQGICSGHPKQISDVPCMVRLWYHENMRVFYDRLTTEEDRLYLSSLLQKQFKPVFDLEVQEVMDHERILFCDFVTGRDSEPKFYQQIVDLEMFLNKMDAFQDDYNSDSTFYFGGQKKPMKLVMFLDACEHISRIARIIRQPSGNALLLGVGGSGRQSLSRMATFMTNYKIFQIEVIKNYNLRSWRDDIKKVLMFAGIENKQISFLFTDTQIIKEQMMEDINNILNSGDVTGIYQEKDYEDIVQACKSECIKKQIPPTKMNIFTQYLIRVKKNIHMIIAMSPLGKAFATRLRMFPSLVNCCTIDWFTEWPEEALIGVGRGQLMDYEEDLGIEGKVPIMVECFKNIHKSVEKLSGDFLNELRRHNYVTPTSYLELLTMFRVILMSKKKEFQLSISRLKSGLDKLDDANRSVVEMKQLLGKMEPELKKASEETEKMLEKLKIDKADADETQRVVAIEEAEASVQEAAARKLAAEAEAAVSDANKQLDTTLEEVKKLKKEHLVEIKSLGSPPEAVKVTLGGVVILLQDRIKKNGGEIIMSTQEGQVGGKKVENYFETAKRYLLNDTRELLELLMTYDKDNIQGPTIKKLEEKCAGRPEFTFAAVERCSFATKFLYMWCKAMMDYYKVFTETKPLREKLVEMRKIVEEKQALLKIKKEALDKINKKIQELEKLFNDKMRQKKELQDKIQECQIKLDRAQKLTDGLSEEKTRWANDIQILLEKSQLVPAHSIIAAGMISYSGPFTSQYRQKLEQKWVLGLQEQNLQHDPRITMRMFLGIPVKIQAWNIAGLPKDDTSTENGLIIDHGRRWPLMIDPQTQANKYIKNLGKDHPEGVEIMKVNDPNLMKQMELAVQFGRWVLLENVGIDLDPSLEPILMQQTTRQGSSLSIQMGDKTLTYSEKFKLYLTTTIPNPHYPPETFVKVTIINFAITPSGLEEQMLAQIVALENPNLEQKKIEIVKKNAQDQKQLLKIEDDILKSLSDTGDIAEILKDESLINQLQTSKKFAAEINQRVKDSKVTEAQIDEARESYRPVAFRASLLFFCIVDLSTIDPMYQYSLQWFTNLFVMGVENSTASNHLEERLQNLNDYFTYSLYENVCRSLFERHKLLFSFMLTVAILKGKNALNLEEWRFYLAGYSGEIKSTPNPTTWISENAWNGIYRQLFGMNLLESMQGIERHFMERPDDFKTIFESPTAHLEPLPLPWNEKLNSFQKMLLIKMIRPDKVIPAIQNYITENIGKQFIIVPTFELAKCFKDSSIITPLIFVLSPGSDPVQDFLKFGEEMQMSKRIDSISLGQGQGPKAEKLMKEAQQRGGWILLQNCHLSQSWMPELEKLCEELNENMHKDFRIWCTSMPASYFPISALQNGIKMTIEPPEGLRSNLLRTYKNTSDTELNDCQKPDIFKKLFFGFALFHAVIQDRRKFGPIGWNIAYEFTNEDLTVCRKQLKMLLDEYAEVPYKVLNFLGSEINYGGRVTDDKDVRLIITILKNYMNKDALRDGYKYSESGLYVSPPAGTLDDYFEYISNLPLNPAPEAFGMHDNAEITNSQNQTRIMLETLLSVQPRESAGSGKSREQQIEEIAQFVQDRTPEVFDIDTIAKVYPTSYEESMNTVLFQELIRYNRLLAVMKSSLVNLKKGLKGLVVLSEDLESVGNSLFDNLVPSLWADKGFLSLKPLSSWTQDLQDRIKFLQDWIDKGTPKVYWISGFFFPQAFFTGTLQNYARKQVIAIDRLAFEYKVLDHQTYQDITEKPESGCYCYGIYLEGARWDSKKHFINWPRAKELYSDVPLMHFVPQDMRVTPLEGIYQCPLYKVVSRRGTLSTTGHSTNFVMFIEFDSKEQQDIWIRAGVAAFLALSY